MHVELAKLALADFAVALEDAPALLLRISGHPFSLLDIEALTRLFVLQKSSRRARGGELGVLAIDDILA